MPGADLLGILLAVLLADPAITAVVGTDLYGDHLPLAALEGQRPETARPMLVLRYLGGSAQIHAEGWIHTVLELRAYGPTVAETDLLRRLALDRLLAIAPQTVSGLRLLALRRGGGPTMILDPESDWRLMRQDVLVTHT